MLVKKRRRLVKSKPSSQGNKSGGAGSERAPALRALYCLYKGNTVTLCGTFQECLITLSACRLIGKALLAIISE